ncbi:MAG: hypothetical protein MK207_16030 [Saprospiraceae bacterium]|nr:hypothetical protein [Saprospiraceae bacterium]
MKIIILKNCLFFIVCLTSSFSYLYLNNQSSLLNKNQTKNVVIVKQNVNLNSKNSSLNKINKGIQEEHTKDKTYSDKQKNDLPDIELFEYFIRKATEGVPLLKFEGFWNLFE